MARNVTFKTKIREELICAVCLDFLQEPKVLLCAHSFCVVCLERIISTNARLNVDSNKNDLECPSCRQITHLTTGKASELKTNFNLKRLVDIVSEEDKKVARDALQRRRTVRPSIRASRTLCKHHHRQFEHFCLDCSELLCPRCITSGHRDHQFQDVDQVLPKQIEQLRSLIQPAYEVASQAESLMSELFEEKNKVMENSSQVSGSVKAYFERIKKMLDEREKAMISTVYKYSDIKLTRLDIQYQMLQQHRATILEGISKIEHLIEDDDNVGLLSQKQTLSEDLDVHEQSIITLAESLRESRKFTSHLLFREDQAVTSNIRDVGILNECRKESNSLLMSLRRVIVSKEEDPYLDVPLRFEDMDGGEHMRIDESKEQVEYEPNSKPDLINQSKQLINQSSDDDSTKFNVYDIPKPVQAPVVKPRVPPRKLSSEKEKPVPPPRPHTSPDHNVPHRPPKPSHFQQNNSKPPKRRSATLPHINSPSFTNSLNHERPGGVDSDNSDYEPLPELPTPSPRTVPPPLPPNHPNNENKSKPIPRPRRQISGGISNPPAPPKRRSRTMPPGVSSGTATLSPQAEVLKPILVIGNDELSWPYSHENVYPSAVCCSPEIQDMLVVTDVFNHCLRLIDYKGKFIEKIGREGRSGGQFKEPSAVAVDPNGHIFVSERDNPRVQKFSATGKYITKFGQKTLWGTQLSDPVAMTVASNGQLVVSDWDKSQIFFFSSAGKLSHVIPKENYFLKLPAGVAFNKKGHLLVADRGNHCIWELTADGDIVGQIGSQGSMPGQLNFPYGVAVTEDDHIIVSESGNSRISVFSMTGDFVRCFGEQGKEPGKFDHPRHLCLNSRRQLIVADEMNQRLQVFEL